MFFPKLRRRAKWVFLFLAIVFATSFVFFGVGAGGSGIGDYLSDFIHNQPARATHRRSTTPATPWPRTRTTPEAQLDLAKAAQAEGQLDEAVAAYEQYRTMKPTDSDAMRSLVALYGRQIADAQRARGDRHRAGGRGLPPEHARAQRQRVPAGAERELRSPTRSAPKAQARANAANAEVQRLSQLQVGVFEELTLLVKDDPLVWLQFAGAAEHGPGLRLGDHRLRGVPRPPAEQPAGRTDAAACRRRSRRISGADALQRLGRTAPTTASRAVRVLTRDSRRTRAR